MNNPRLDAGEEALWAAANGFTFLDLTLEGPRADLENLDQHRLGEIIRQTGLGVIGHTAWYLPFASPFARIRQAAVESVVETFDCFARLGAKWVNVHIAAVPALFSREDMVRWNGECFAQIVERASGYPFGIMVEHIPDRDARVQEIRQILDVDARLHFHLDVGHAVIGSDKLEGLLRALQKRLVHVHLSDNFCRSDDHLPLGAGRIDWKQTLRLLRQAGYDGTMTLEVFTPDRDYLLLSAQKVRTWWQEILTEEREHPEAFSFEPRLDDSPSEYESEIVEPE